MSFGEDAGPLHGTERNGQDPHGDASLSSLCSGSIGSASIGNAEQRLHLAYNRGACHNSDRVH